MQEHVLKLREILYKLDPNIFRYHMDEVLVKKPSYEEEMVDLIFRLEHFADVNSKRMTTIRRTLEELG